MNVSNTVSSSGAVSMKSRLKRSTSAASSRGCRISPASASGPEGVEVELELGDDAEVAAAAAQRPEEVRVLVFARANDLALGGHQLERAQAVDREPVATHHPADAAAEREPADAGVGDVAEGDRQRVRRHRRLGDVVEQRAAAHASDPRIGIDHDRVHRREVDGHSAVGHRMAGDAVAAAADRDLEVGVAGGEDRRSDVVLAFAAARSAPGGGRPSRSRACAPRRSGRRTGGSRRRTSAPRGRAERGWSSWRASRSFLRGTGRHEDRRATPSIHRLSPLFRPGCRSEIGHHHRSGAHIRMHPRISAHIQERQTTPIRA